MKVPWQAWVFLLVLILVAYATRDILLPFVSGLAVAYLLDPLADRLEGLKMPRWAAAATILTIFFISLSLLIVGITPIVQSQVSGILTNLPSYVASIRPAVDQFLLEVNSFIGNEHAADSQSLLAAAIDQGTQELGGLIRSFLTQSMAFFNLVSLLIISPVVAFFLLRDWDLIVSKVDGWIPKNLSSDVRELFIKVDLALAGFIRGQTLVALSMAVLYSVGWSIAGLNYSLILGIIAGILAYVPFVGALFAAFIAILIAIGQYGADFSAIFPVFLVFVIVQILEAAVLTPRFIGTRVGLHPVWVLFAIFAGGELMGFVGVLISLPVAAAVGVFVRYGVDIYLGSILHKGDEGGKK